MRVHLHMYIIHIYQPNDLFLLMSVVLLHNYMDKHLATTMGNSEITWPWENVNFPQEEMDSIKRFECL